MFEQSIRFFQSSASQGLQSEIRLTNGSYMQVEGDPYALGPEDTKQLSKGGAKIILQALGELKQYEDKLGKPAIDCQAAIIGIVRVAAYISEFPKVSNSLMARWFNSHASLYGDRPEGEIFSEMSRRFNSAIRPKSNKA